MANRAPKTDADASAETTPSAAPVADDVAAARTELQGKADEQTEKGYFGTTADPFPNEAYSLQSGPDSPSAAEVADAIRPAAKATQNKEA